MLLVFARNFLGWLPIGPRGLTHGSTERYPSTALRLRFGVILLGAELLAGEHYTVGSVRPRFLRCPSWARSGYPIVYG